MDLAAWRRDFAARLAGKYLPAVLPAPERDEALRSLERIIARCSPDALPTKRAVQDALHVPLTAHRERVRRAAEEERRAEAYRIVNENLPTDMSREDYPRADAAMEAQLSARPEATAKEIADEVLAPLHLASRQRKARRDYLAAARRDIEDLWDRSVLRLEEEEQRLLRRHWKRTWEAKDQSRIDFLAELAKEERLLPYGDRGSRQVEERLSALIQRLRTTEEDLKKSPGPM